MLHLLFWIWTYAIDEPCDEQNSPIYLTYAILPVHSEGAKARISAFATSLLAEVGGDVLLWKMAAVIADSPRLYGVELENAIDIFDFLIMAAGREYLDRIPVLHALQRSFSRYRLQLERPGYGYGIKGNSDAYRKFNMVAEGFDLLK